jgi:hypothetical protein
LRALAALLGLVSLAAGCGLTTSESPEAMSQENLPEELGGPPETVPPDGVEGEQTDARFWFVDDSGDPIHLVSIADEVPELSPQILIETLINYDVRALNDEGYRNAVPPSIAPSVSLDEDTGILTVDLPAAFYDGPDTGEGRLAFGQVVLTVSILPQVDRVRFLRDGQDVVVTDGDGEEQRRPVQPRDYENLLPPD